MLQFYAPVHHVPGDACARPELDGLIARYLSINRTGHDKMCRSHLAIDARLVADHQRADVLR